MTFNYSLVMIRQKIMDGEILISHVVLLLGYKQA